MRSDFRHITILAISALVLCLHASCSKDKDTGYDGPEIILSANTNSTKASVSSKSDLISQSYTGGFGFGVNGYKTVTGGSIVKLFNNVEVTPLENSDDTKWTYTPVRFWDKNPQASYQFIAYWPYIGNTTPSESVPYVSEYTDEDNKYMELVNIPNWQLESSGKDYMIATKLGKYNPDFAQTGIVPFTFNHLLTKLIVKAYYIGKEKNTVTITGLQVQQSANGVYQVPKTDGGTTFRTKYGLAPEAGKSATSQINTQYGGTHELLTANYEIPESAFWDEDPQKAPAPVTVCTWLVIPCNWAGLRLNISYKIVDSEADPVIIDQFMSQTVSGNTYTLTLVFNSKDNGIGLGGIQVKDWTDADEITPEVYNW